MHQHDVKEIDIQFQPEPIDGLTGRVPLLSWSQGGRIHIIEAIIHLGEDCDILSRQVAQGFAKTVMISTLVRLVEEADTTLVATLHQLHEILESRSGLIRLASRPLEARALSYSCCRNTCVT